MPDFFQAPQKGGEQNPANGKRAPSTGALFPMFMRLVVQPLD